MLATSTIWIKKNHIKVRLLKKQEVSLRKVKLLHMLFKKHLFIVCSLLLFYACKQELKTTFSEINITTETNKLVEVNIPKAIGGNTISNTINSEINNLVINALEVGEPNNSTSKSIEESINAFNEEYDAFNKDFPDSAMLWEAQIDGEILFESPEIISISITSYLNTGGANGNTVITFLNFDAQTGKRLQNTDLIKNDAGFKTLAASYFKKNLKDEDMLFKPDSFQLPENMGYVEDGIHLLYNTYEIAPYAMGIIEFTIPFEKVRPFLVFNGA